MFTEVISVLQLFGPRPDADQISDVDRQLMRVGTPLVRAMRKYFRAEVNGLEKIPKGKALLVGNHNGGITFMEPFFLGLGWMDYTGGEDFMYWLGHDAMVDMPLVGNLLVKLGVIRANHGVADAAFAKGKKVVVFPGGNYEAFRPYTQRHLIDFGGKTGYIKLALRNGAPIVPVLSFGGHETFFVLWRGEWLAEKTGLKSLLRSESCPVFLGAPYGIGLGPLFHFPLPAKMIVDVGDPISLDGYGPEHLGDAAVLSELSMRVQQKLQQMMDRRAAERRWPLLG